MRSLKSLRVGRVAVLTLVVAAISGVVGYAGLVWQPAAQDKFNNHSEYIKAAELYNKINQENPTVMQIPARLTLSSVPTTVDIDTGSAECDRTNPNGKTTLGYTDFKINSAQQVEYNKIFLCNQNLLNTPAPACTIAFILFHEMRHAMINIQYSDGELTGAQFVQAHMDLEAGTDSLILVVLQELKNRGCPPPPK